MRIFLGLAAILVLLNFGCATKVPAPPVTNRKSLVLIHGAHFDASVWEALTQELKTDPNFASNIFPITLLGRTEEEHANLTEMAQDACAKITGPAMLVAHSFGGGVVNQMAGICPNKINRIIYVAAVVPLSGEKVFQVTTAKDQRAYERAVTFDKSRMSPKAPAEFFKALDAELDPQTLTAVHLFTESYGPGQDKVNFEALRFEKIPKYYIYTSLDKVLGTETQKKFVKRTPMIKTETITSGHLPMLSKPKELASAIRKFLD